MAAAPNELLTDLLRDVSRSFYTTLRVLPGAVRPQIGLAYLLARTADTIADTELVSLDLRLESLRRLRDRILESEPTPAGQSATALPSPLDFGELARHQGSPAESILLDQCDASVAMLKALSATDRKLVREVLQTIISGQELDLRRFGSSNPSPHRGSKESHEETAPSAVGSLRTHEELDDYTYRVAGCVGEFWTKICRTHLFPEASLDDALLVAQGIRFGKGLQLINILRDLPVDLRNGRCYLPSEELQSVDLLPADLLEPANEPKLRPLYDRYLDLANQHLESGWQYTHLIPRRQVRVRLACAWPILIGARTLVRLRNGKVLDPSQRIKISRAEVRQIMVGSILRYPFPNGWREQLSHYMR